LAGRFKHILVFWICCIISIHTDGQEVPWIAGSVVHTGFLVNHHNNMKVLNEKIPYIYELYIAKTTSGEKAWHSFYRNPRYGVSYMLFDLGSPSYLGKAHGIYPFMNFLLTQSGKRASLNMQIGGGIAYMEKIFNRFDNYKNIAISSRFNAIINFRMEGRVQVAAPLHLSGGWALSHISNGTIKKPNAGLNYVTVHAGINYAFGKERFAEAADAYSYEIDRKWHYTVYLSGGVKSYSIYDNAKYAVSGLSFEASRSHLAFTRFSGVFDLFYDSSDYAYLVDKEVEISKIQTIKPALAAGYVFLFGNLSANVQMGRYLYAKNQQYGALYQRLGLGYSISDRLNARFGLKTHWSQADYIEFSLGYMIN